MSSTIIKEARKHRIVCLIMQLTLLFVIGLYINRQEASAANLSLSVSGPATLDLMPHTTTGDFAKSNDITITASADGGVGYKLIIQAANSTSLTGGVNTIESLDAGTSITESEFANGNYSGKWGYKPSMFNSVANSTFRPSPSTTTGDVINETICANGTTNCPDNEDTYTISIGAKVDLSQPIGSYENAFNIIIVGNVEYSIIYRNTLVTNMPEDTAGETDSATVAISSTVPVHDGYIFLGWCTVMPTVSGACSGTSYAPGDTYTLSSGGANALTLYARWTRSSGLYLQDQTLASLATKMPNVGDTTTLYDRRDGQAYTVGKLADGKYWMLEDLNLAGGTALGSVNTDVTDEYISGFTTGGNLTKSGNFITLPASATKNSDNAHLTDSTQFSDNAYAYVFNSGNNTSTCDSSTPCNSYYSWIAATLGGKQADGSTDETRSGYNAAASICPKGWRLPTSTTSNTNPQSNNNWKTGDWYALATAYGANLESNYNENAATFYNNAGPGTTPNFLLAGSYDSGSFSNGGSRGSYWSATLGIPRTISFNLNFTSSYVSSANYNTPKAGYPVRCVARDDYLQGQTLASLATKMPNVGDTTTLYDKRDDQAYTVGKLADGKYWMLEDLNLAGGTALGSVNTDVTDEYISGFTTGGNLTKSGNSIILPASATKNTDNNNLSDSTQFKDAANAYVFNSGNTTNCGASGQNTPCYSYYSWIAATLGGKQTNGSTAVANYNNAAASICPKGWRLPTSTTSNAGAQSNNNWKTGDWYALATAYGANLESNYNENAATFYNNAGPGTTSNFLLAGYYTSGSFYNGGSGGSYWSATTSASTLAYELNFRSSYVDSAGGCYHNYGNLVRCVLSE